MTSPERSATNETTKIITVEQARQILEEQVAWYEQADPLDIEPMDTFFYNIDKETLADPQKIQEFAEGFNRITLDMLKSSPDYKQSEYNKELPN